MALRWLNCGLSFRIYLCDAHPSVSCSFASPLGIR